uniref:Uncharacterized protein n=1 Tax=Globodera rostochiensis TaxID=31243 RepID=A0A914HFZ4_GLORO
MEPSSSCAKVRCGKESECREGKCALFAGRPCGRNVLVAEGLARAVVSDCGPQGKCIGGRCAIDKCAEVLCDELSELCRDGMCFGLSTMFCFSPFDCGPPSLFECRQNKCQRRRDTIAPSFSPPTQKCDPGETFIGDKCVTQEGCAQLVCSSGQSCFNGFCVASSGHCVPDICKVNGGKCLPENACSPMSVPEGECRPYQGIPCSLSAAAEDCPPPYFCIGGICSKDDCFRKVCQIGERCDGGLCVRVEGNACRDALRECGEHFDCVAGYCKDRIKPYTDGGNRTTTAVGGGGTFGVGK